MVIPTHFKSVGFEQKMKLIYSLFSSASVDIRYLKAWLSFRVCHTWCTRALLGVKRTWQSWEQRGMDPPKDCLLWAAEVLCRPNAGEMLVTAGVQETWDTHNKIGWKWGCCWRNKNGVTGAGRREGRRNTWRWCIPCGLDAFELLNKYCFAL